MSDIDTLLQEITEVRSFVAEKVEQGIEPLKEEMDRLKETIISANEEMKEIRKSRIRNMSSDGKLMVPEGRYMGYDALDLQMIETVFQKRVEAGETHPEWVEGVQDARKALLETVTPESLYAWEERGMKERRVAYGYSDFNPGSRKFKDELSAWRSSMLDTRQKAMDSTTPGAGDELVSTIQASQLWMDVNLDTVVLPILNQIPMPSNPFQMPLQLGDTNWYPIAQNVQALTTDPATQRVTMTAQGLKTGVPFSDELDEDSIIAFVPELRRNLSRNASEVIDDVLLNADQTVTDGINSDGATIDAETAGKAQWLLGFDGLIHLPLIDNTSQLIIHTAVPSADMFNELLARLGKYAAPRRRGDVVFISDVNTAIRSLSITEFETVDVAGARATLSTGEILNVYGKPYLHSEQMALAEDADGKVTDAGNSSDTGRLLVLNTSQWRVGFRRQITMESERSAGQGQTTLYVSFRIALLERSGTRSTATHTAINRGIRGVA